MDATLQSTIEAYANDLASQASTFADLGKILQTFMKTAFQIFLNSEMDLHLINSSNSSLEELSTSSIGTSTDPSVSAKTGKNRRNGYSRKTLQTELGEIPLDIPRDRQGTFEPKVVGKYQRRLDGFDNKILALYAKGLTTRDIAEVIHDFYEVDVSPSLISDITAKVQAEVNSWQTRRLDGVWPIVYFDGIVVHVRGDSGRISQHTMYVAIGVNLKGKKELLGLWLAETEGAKFWLSCLTDLKNRGLQDVFVACVDGLTGFPEAIRTVYPQTKVQLCVVHLVRAALKYVTDKDSKEVIKDLKTIYQAATVKEAEQALEDFGTKWDNKYPTIAKQWRAKWVEISAMFEFSLPIRKAIYTTNAIESVNSVIRKFTRNRKQYPSKESAIKLIYMAIEEAAKKWTMPIPGWKQALNQFAILFEGRLPSHSN